MKKIPIAIAAVMAGCALTSGVSLCIPKARARAAEEAVFDYSVRGIEGMTVDCVDLLESVYHTQVDPVEADWLKGESTFSLKYCDAIPSSLIEITEGEETTVSARPYSYTSTAGKKVTFTPSSVGDVPFLQQGENYVATINGGTMSEDSLSIIYEAFIGIPADTVNSLAGKAYAAGDEIVEKMDLYGPEGSKFKEEQAQYEEDLQKYREYLAAVEKHDEDERLYEAYRAELSDWKKRDEAYQTYQNALSAYNEQKAKYDQYVSDYEAYRAALEAYNNYRLKMEQYEKEKAEYDAAIGPAQADMERALTQLSYLDFIEVPTPFYREDTKTTEQRSLYTAIMGDSVMQVLNRRKEYYQLYPSLVPAVDRAAAATQFLRNDLIPKYHAIRNGTFEEKYAFYLTYYEQARENFCELFRALEWLDRDSVVHQEIENRDRVPQYNLMLAQFYVICNLLTDGTVSNYDTKYLNAGDKFNFDQKYTIHGQKPEELLKGTEGIPVDEDKAAPFESVPALPTEPTLPEEVSRPQQPAEVREPSGPPAEVALAGQRPAEVPAPGPVPEKVTAPKEPTPYVPSETEKALLDGVREGKIVPREPIAEDFSLPVYAVCKKYLPSANAATVRFYLNENGGDYVEMDILPGEEPDLSKIAPYKDEVGKTQKHTGWQKLEGDIRVPVLLSEIGPGEHLELYPSFLSSRNFYPVVWEIEGRLISTQFEFGSSPVFSGTIECVGDGIHNYRFLGWEAGDEFYPVNENLPPVSESGAYYKARFEELPLIGGEGEDVDLAYDEEKGEFSADFSSPVPEDAPLEVEIGDLFQKASGMEAGVSLTFEDRTLGFDQSAAKAISEQGIDKILTSFEEEVSAEEQPPAYTFSVRLFKGEEEKNIECSCNIYADVVLHAAHRLVSSAGEFVSFDEVNTPPRARRALSDTQKTRISFLAKAGETYELVAMYKVEVLGCDFATVGTSTLQGLARPGQQVEITLGDIAAGRYLSAIRVYTHSEDKEIPVTENAFTMPAENVYVSVNGAYYTYTVTFRSEGKTIYTRTYRYGDRIELPPDPFKPSDETYSYTFAGWDHEVGECTGNEQFVARFTQELLPEDTSDPGADPTILGLAIGIPVSVVVVAAVIVAIVVMRKRPRRSDED